MQVHLGFLQYCIENYRNGPECRRLLGNIQQGSSGHDTVCHIRVLLDLSPIGKAGLSRDPVIEVSGKCIPAENQKPIEPDPDFLYNAVRPADMRKRFAGGAHHIKDDIDIARYLAVEVLESAR
jgi:hypothetical protein